MSYSEIFQDKVLFHYTNFESAVKILLSMKLRFGEFGHLNDIAENSREIFSNVSAELVEEELNKYRTISLTKDDTDNRGFSIESLWGYYAEKGNGVCLTFNEKSLRQELEGMNLDHKYGEITYSSGSNANFILPQEGECYKNYIKNHLEDLFFCKDNAWKHEQEYRLLVYSNDSSLVELSIEKSLLAVVLCSPHNDKISETPEYKAISHIVLHTPILRYKRNLGNKSLEDCNGLQIWPLIGRDLNVDI